MLLLATCSALSLFGRNEEKKLRAIHSFSSLEPRAHVGSCLSCFIFSAFVVGQPVQLLSVTASKAYRELVLQFFIFCYSRPVSTMSPNA